MFHPSILIIGATGFIGKNLVERLSKEKYQIVCLVRKGSKKKDIDFLKKFNVKFIYGDLEKKETLNHLDMSIEIVFYLAGGGNVASLSKKDFSNLQEYNLKTLENFLESIHKIKKIIFFSSVSAIGVQKGKIINENTPCMPFLPHEKCKHSAEELIKKYSKIKKYDFSILRPSIVYGEKGIGDSFNMIKMIDRGFFLMPGNGENITPWVYVKNVVEATILLIQKGKNETYIINNEEKLSFNKIIRSISKSLSKKIILIHLPVFLIKQLVFILEKISLLFNKSPIINMYRLSSMTSDRLYSIKKIKRIGYKQKYNFKESMLKTTNWYKNVPR